MTNLEKLKNVSFHTIVFGMGSIVQAAAGFVLLPFLTKILSKQEFGIYSILLAISSIAGAVFFLGIASALPRSYLEHNDERKREEVFTTGFVLVIAGALFQVIFGYILSGWLSEILLGDGRYSRGVFLAILSSAMIFVNGYFVTYLRLIKASLRSVSYALFGTIFTIFFTFWYISNKKLSVDTIFLSVVAGQFLIFLLFVVNNRSLFLRLNFRELEAEKLLKFGLPIVIGGMGQMLMDWSDRFIIERVLSLVEVGEYSATFRVSSIVNILLVFPFVQIWPSIMMEYRNSAKIKEIFRYAIRGMLVTGLAFIAVTSVFSFEILSLIIKMNITNDMVISFVILELYCIFFGLTNIVNAGLVYSRNMGRLVYVYWAGAILKIVLNLVLIPVYGIIGASIVCLSFGIAVPCAVHKLAAKFFEFNLDLKNLAIAMGLMMLLIFAGTLSAVAGASFPIKMSIVVIVFIIAPIIVVGQNGRGFIFNLIKPLK